MIEQPTAEKSMERDPLLEGCSEDSAEHRLLQTSSLVNVNSCWYLFLSQIGKCLLGLVSISGAYFFVLATYQRLIPHCYEYGNLHNRVACNVTSFCFWTYPLVCPLVIVVLYFRNMLETRLFYECLLNRILVNIDSDPWSKVSVWVVLVWGAFAAGMVGFMNSSQPTIVIVCSLLAYFTPILTFLSIFFGNLNIETHLIPLPSFCSTDPRLAGELLQAASHTFVPEAQMRVAFENTNDLLLIRKEQLDSASFFRVLREEAQKEMAAVRAEIEPEDPNSFKTRLFGFFGLKERNQYALQFPSTTRPEVRSESFSLRHGYWVYRLLFNKYLVDDHSRSFRRWCAGFLVFIAFSLAIFLYTMSHTLAEFLVYEHLAASPWIQSMRWGVNNEPQAAHRAEAAPGADAVTGVPAMLTHIAKTAMRGALSVSSSSGTI